VSQIRLESVLAAAPRLQVLNAHVTGDFTALLPVMRNDPPYGPLRICKLDVCFEPALVESDVLALATAVAANESLKDLSFHHGYVARWVNTLVDAAAERRVSWFLLDDCTLDAEFVPALARLLQRGSLAELHICCDGFPHADEEKVLELCGARSACMPHADAPGARLESA
jgi:hypothetical protein